jgi:hypothetical protein
MQQILDLISSIKDVLNLSPEKRLLILSWFLFGGVIYYLYNENNRLVSEITNINISHRKNLDEINANCEKILNSNRELFQNQLNSFIVKSNNERDSTFSYFYKTMEGYNKRIIEIRKITNKNENNN